jgi:glycosyltransferase involved in cell wall biosynthesis
MLMDGTGAVGGIFNTEDNAHVGPFLSDFLVGCHDVRSQDDKEYDIEDGILDVLRNTDVSLLVVGRNKKTILDSSLRSRVLQALSELQRFKGTWMLASPGGLGATGDKYCSMYSSTDPFLLVNRWMMPIVDTTLDLYVLNAEALREFYADRRWLRVGSLFEVAVILYGYERKAISFYLPNLACAINGPFLSRDPIKFLEDASRYFDSADSVTLQTLMGEISVPPIAEKPAHQSVAASVAHSPFKKRIYREISTLLEQHTAPISLSIVTRTQFKRLALLRRLLTSIVTASYEKVMLEIVLSTDVAGAVAQKKFALIKQEFPMLNLRLVTNRERGASRVRNLVGGAKAAKSDYIWFVDDDDYVHYSSLSSFSREIFSDYRPLVFAQTQAVEEVWEGGDDSEFPILVSSSPSTFWDSDGWRNLGRGVNHVPICGAIIPRSLLVSCLKSFDFSFDLSEDYTLFLLLLAAPTLPKIVSAKFIGCVVSLRAVGENSVTAIDRTRWCRDIHGFLFDLLFSPTGSEVGKWDVITGMGRIQTLRDGVVLEQLHALAQEKDTEIQLLKRAVEFLRSQLESAKNDI